MPLRLEIKKKLTARSDRIKSVDLHPTEPWVLSALYTGNIFIWDYSSGAMVKSFEVCDLPVRSAKFIVRKSWFIAASDDMFLRVYNYNTMEKVKAWEAHMDYIRYVEVHPTLPYVLSASDDMTIKLFDWDKNWDCTQVFEGHAHYVMMVKFNLKDTSVFASASLDRTIKVWGLGSHTPHFSLEGHEKGVNSIDYYPGGDKPYLLSGADDNQVRIWDYQTKACVQTLEGHTHNVAAVLFHPRLPIIISGSEDGTVRIWHSTTYRAETTLNYGMERVWSLAASRDSNKVAIGYDEGTIVVKLGQEMPVASMDTNTGKLVWAVNNDIFTSSVKGLASGVSGGGLEDGTETPAAAAAAALGDGERLSIIPRDLGSTEIFPQSLVHNCNGRFIVVCGDGEYIIYTSQALRNKSFGSALDFVWSAVGTGDYAIRESISRIKIFRNFVEKKAFKPPVPSAEGIFGGHCLAVRGSDCVIFLDWEEGALIRRIDVTPRAIYWNETGEIVLLACDDSYFVLRYNKEAVAAAIASGQVGEEGIEEAFELLHELSDKVRTGMWVGDCFLYTNNTQRLQYYVGGQIMTLCHLDSPKYMLGYLAKEDRVYLMDKQLSVVSYKVLLSVLQYQTAVVRQDFGVANALLPNIPEGELSNVARFLESQGYKEEALVVSRDPDQQFELALDLKKLSVATDLLAAIRKEDKDSMDTQSKWRKLGDLALVKSDFALAEKCAWEAQDWSGLLLLYTSLGDGGGLLKLAQQATAQGKGNVGFLAFFLLGKMEECLELLIKTDRIPEAAFLARTYLPSQMSRVVTLWKENLSKISPPAAEALADPSAHPSLFPDLDVALQVEQLFLQNRSTPLAAGAYPTAKGDMELDLISLIKNGGASALPTPPPLPPAAIKTAAGAPSPSSSPPPPAASSGVSPRAVAAAAGTAADAAAKAQQEQKGHEQQLFLQQQQQQLLLDEQEKLSRQEAAASEAAAFEATQAEAQRVKEEEAAAAAAAAAAVQAEAKRLQQQQEEEQEREAAALRAQQEEQRRMEEEMAAAAAAQAQKEAEEQQRLVQEAAAAEAAEIAAAETAAVAAEARREEEEEEERVRLLQLAEEEEAAAKKAAENEATRLKAETDAILGDEDDW